MQSFKHLFASITLAAMLLLGAPANAQTASQLVSYTNGQLPTFGATSITVANVRDPIISLTTALSVSGTGTFVYAGGVSTTKPISSSSYVSATTFYGDGSHLTGLTTTPNWYTLTGIPTSVANISNTSFITSPTAGNLFFGPTVGNVSTTGTNNVAFGINSLNLITQGSSNTAVGQGALSQVTVGGRNAAFGYGAALASSGANGVDSVAIGYNSLLNALAPYRSVSIGSMSSYLAPFVSNSTCVGYQACGTAIGFGHNRLYGNTTLGSQAGGNLSDAQGNTLLGYLAATTLSIGNGNIVIGNGISPSNVPVSSTSNYLNIGNTIFGDLTNSLPAGGAAKVGINVSQTLTTASLEVSGTISATAFVGNGAGLTNLPVLPLTWYNITAIPTQVAAVSNSADISVSNVSATGFNGVVVRLMSPTSAFPGVAIGTSNTGSAVASNNIAIGYNALPNATSGGSIGIGRNTLVSLTTNNNSTAIGDQAFRDYIGGEGVAIGASAGLQVNAGHGVYIGFAAGSLSVSSTGAVAIGWNALARNVSGTDNVCIGDEACRGQASSGPNNNVVIGTGGAGSRLVSGSGNVFLGYRSGIFTTTGAGNVFIGRQTGGNNTIGSGSIAIGGNGGTGVQLFSTTDDNQLNIGNSIYGSMKVSGTNLVGGASMIGINIASPTLPGLSVSGTISVTSVASTYLSLTPRTVTPTAGLVTGTMVITAAGTPCYVSNSQANLWVEVGDKTAACSFVPAR